MLNLHFKLHDTHAHLNMVLENVQNVDLENLLENHSWLIHPTVSNEDFVNVYSAFQHNPKISFLLGSHPETVVKNFNVTEYLQKQKDILETSPKIIGIGECGLDYFYTQDAEILDLQKKLFASQIELAIHLNLPLVIHVREAFDGVIDILKNYPKIHNNFLVHCFTGDRVVAKDFLDMGGRLAFGGILTFKNAEYLREAFRFTPDDSWVLETDCPFLSPFRGKTCLPEHIYKTGEVGSKNKNLTQKQIWEMSESNSKNLFTKLVI